jgi:guanine deaminase
MKPSYTLFYGTFIDLPRVSAAASDSHPKHSLSINHGVLWVSGADSCISGFDWAIASEDELNVWLERKGWKVVDCIGNDEAQEEKPDISTVVIVKAKREQNGFFFPGFIGMSPFPCSRFAACCPS